MAEPQGIPDEITIEQIKEYGIENICFQMTTRGRLLWKSAFVSTSFFINRNFLLTSAHNVVKTYRNVTKIEISPSRVGDTLHFGSLSMDFDYQKHLQVYPEYSMTNKATRSLYDIAIIYVPDYILDSNPGLSALNHLPILEDISSVSDGEKVYCAGYPASGRHKGRYRMTMDTSDITGINEHSFSHQLATMTGNSGSPIMVKRDGKFYVIGVNSIKFDGTLLNNEKKQWIEKSMQILAGDV